MNISKLLSSLLPLPSNCSLNTFPHREISKKYPFQLFYHYDSFKYFFIIPDCFNSPTISHSEKTSINVIYTDYTREKGRSTTNENDSLQYVPNIPTKQNTFSAIYCIIIPKPSLTNVMLQLKRNILLSDQNPFPKIYLIEHVLY